MTPCISIIVPCYNLSAFLPQTLDSVLSQSNKDWECIIIDDGSTDDTPQVAKSYCNRDDRITYYLKENGGLSAARNKGIEIARGTYLMFLDADDWIHEDAVEKLSNKVVKDDLDVLIADLLFYYTKDNIRHVYQRNEAVNSMGIKNGIDYFIQLKSNECYAPMSVNQIYKTSFIRNNNLSFEDKLINEDELWTPQVLLKAKRVNTLNYPFYYYRQRENSIMNSIISLKKMTDNIYIANTLVNMAEEQDNPELRGWLWVKAFELYYRVYTRFSPDKNEKKKLAANSYSGKKLLYSDIPRLQFDICLKRMLMTYPNAPFLQLMRFKRKIERKLSRL